MDELLRPANPESAPRTPWHRRIHLVAAFYAILAVVAVLARLPFAWAVFLGRLMAYPWQRILRSNHRRNLAHCYGAGAWSEAQIQSFGRQRADYFARFGAVMGRLIAADPESVLRWSSVLGGEVLQQTLALKRGALVVGAHYGFWFLAPCILAAHGFPIAVLVRPVRSGPQARFIQQLANRFGVTLVNVGHNAMPDIQRAFRENKVVCLAFDVPIRKKASARFRFGLGTVRFDQGAAVLAVRHKLPVFFISVPADHAPRVQIHLEPAASAQSGEEKLTPEELTQAWCNRTYEQVTRSPAQWIRWNGRDVIQPASTTELESQPPKENGLNVV